MCFEDEAGQNLRPPKARTWAPRGHTPVVRVSGKGSGRVSVAGLVCVKPGCRGRLFYRVRVHRGRKGERRSMSEADYAGLITAAHQQLHAPVILIWDNLNTHISAVMRTFTGAHPDWLTVIQLPSYAPDLNPAEGVWDEMLAAEVLRLPREAGWLAIAVDDLVEAAWGCRGAFERIMTARHRLGAVDVSASAVRPELARLIARVSGAPERARRHGSIMIADQAARPASIA